MRVGKATFADKAYMTINYTLLTLFSLTTIYPFIYFLALSFNDGYDAMKGGVYLLPRVFTLDNCNKAFQHPLILNGSVKFFYCKISITTDISGLWRYSSCPLPQSAKMAAEKYI